VPQCTLRPDKINHIKDQQDSWPESSTVEHVQWIVPLSLRAIIIEELPVMLCYGERARNTLSHPAAELWKDQLKRPKA
jgi:hypothetical protein